MKNRRGGEGGGVLNSFRLLFFFCLSLLDYVFQRDLPNAATRLDHQVSEKKKAETDREIENIETASTG